MIDSLCVIVLCKNESLHIRRCIKSALALTSKIFVVDSYSTDSTLELLTSFPTCRVVQRTFLNHAEQFNWALDNLPWSGISWVLRLDADELLHDNFPSLLLSSGYLDSFNLHAISLRRAFMVNDSIVRFAGLSPRCVRLVRPYIRYPFQLMDEHFVVPPQHTAHLDAYIYDHSLKSFSWWFEKHFQYSKNEAIQFLASLTSWRSLYPELASISKSYTFQQRLYYRFPLFVRPALFFLFRFVILLGFLNRPSSCRFIFFQCFVYRFFVDFWIFTYSFDKFMGDFRSFEYDLDNSSLI